MPYSPIRSVITPAMVAVLLGMSSCSTSTPERASTASTASPSTDSVAHVVKELKAQSALGGVLESIRAVLVTVRGRTVVEFYNGGSAATPHNTFSVTKSVTSTLIGIALAEGSLKSLDQTLGDLLPAHAKSMKPSTSAITLRQLLTMTSGLPDDSNPANGLDFSKSRDWVQDTLRGGIVHAPGTFDYASAGTHLLSAILVQATRMSVLDYARAKLFDPLGIVTRPAVALTHIEGSKDYERRYEQAGFTWPVDSQGIQLGFSMLKLRPVDLGKLGQLYLDGGRWEGRQVVPADWVREATTSKVAGRGQAEGYGYQWWVTNILTDPAYFASGYGGQMVMVIPKRQMVVVVSSAADQKDSTAFGVDTQVLTYFVSTTIAPAFPPQR